MDVIILNIFDEFFFYGKHNTHAAGQDSECGKQGPRTWTETKKTEKFMFFMLHFLKAVVHRAVV